MHILTAAQMKRSTAAPRERFGIPSIVLMENAALAVVDAIFEHYPDCDRVAIFCGTGANGGDGFAVARHLENRGVVPMRPHRRRPREDQRRRARRISTSASGSALPIYDITRRRSSTTRSRTRRTRT